jgi:hypothetical protein
MFSATIAKATIGGSRPPLPTPNGELSTSNSAPKASPTTVASIELLPSGDQ